MYLYLHAELSVLHTGPFQTCPVRDYSGFVVKNYEDNMATVKCRHNLSSGKVVSENHFIYELV